MLLHLLFVFISRQPYATPTALFTSGRFCSCSCSRSFCSCSCWQQVWAYPHRGCCTAFAIFASCRQCNCKRRLHHQFPQPSPLAAPWPTPPAAELLVLRALTSRLSHFAFASGAARAARPGRTSTRTRLSPCSSPCCRPQINLFSFRHRRRGCARSRTLSCSCSSRCRCRYSS